MICHECGKELPKDTRLSLMIDAAVVTEQLRREGRAQFNPLTGGVTPIVIKPDLSELGE